MDTIIQETNKAPTLSPKPDSYHYSSISGLAKLIGFSKEETQALVDIAAEAIKRGLKPASKHCECCRHQLIDQAFDTIIPYFARR